MLTPEEKTLLEKYVENHTPDAPYWARVQIVLLADAGWAQADIAATLRLRITPVRTWQRAFNRHRLTVFPETLFLDTPLFAPTEGVGEAGRCLLGEMQQKVQAYWPAAATYTDPLAVHEFRKAIRQSFTIYRVFAPYFLQGTLAHFRRRWRKVMRRLGRSRDITIFLQGLETHLAGDTWSPVERAGLECLRDVWQERLAAANATLQTYLNQEKVRPLLENYGQFLAHGQTSLISPLDTSPAYQIRFVAPRLINDKVIMVRQHHHLVTGGTLAELHQLRIDFKELRYTLRFFAPLLGLPVLSCLYVLEQIQDHLGWLNDARVGLELLDEMQGEETSAAANLYRALLQARADTLRTEFLPLWEKFDSLAWRQNLGLALARL